MTLITELEKRINGDIILIDGCVITPYEDVPLSRLLYDGLESLENLEMVLISRRSERLTELSQLMQTHDVATIPQVCTELYCHLRTLNMQHIRLRNELRELVREISYTDASYYRSMLEVIKSYNS